MGRIQLNIECRSPSLRIICFNTDVLVSIFELHIHNVDTYIVHVFEIRNETSSYAVFIQIGIVKGLKFLSSCISVVQFISNMYPEM